MNKLEFASSALMIFSVPIFLFAAAMLYQSFREAGYQSVNGTVNSSKIEKYRYTRAGETGGSVSWRLYVDYEYQFAGQNYNNDTVSTSFPISTTLFGRPPSKKLTFLFEKYQSGKTVKVFVNSHNPSKSVLIPLTHFKGIRWLLLGIAFLLTAYILRIRI